LLVGIRGIWEGSVGCLSGGADMGVVERFEVTESDGEVSK
jgi:hypothetical protein